MLCSQCQALFQGEIIIQRRGHSDFHEKQITWESSCVQLSAVGDCFLCHRIHQYLLWRPDELWANPTQPLSITLRLRKLVSVAHFGTLSVSIACNDRSSALNLELGLSEIKGDLVER